MHYSCLLLFCRLLLFTSDALVFDVESKFLKLLLLELMMDALKAEFVHVRTPFDKFTWSTDICFWRVARRDAMFNAGFVNVLVIITESISDFCFFSCGWCFWFDTMRGTDGGGLAAGHIDAFTTWGTTGGVIVMEDISTCVVFILVRCFYLSGSSRYCWLLVLSVAQVVCRFIRGNKSVYVALANNISEWAWYLLLLLLLFESVNAAWQSLWRTERHHSQ